MYVETIEVFKFITFVDGDIINVPRWCGEAPSGEFSNRDIYYLSGINETLNKIAEQQHPLDGCYTDFVNDNFWDIV